MRVAVIGNSGSGKSTLAGWLAARSGAACLDLDSVAWEPGKVAVARPMAVARADVQSFCSSEKDWVVEGCYAGLIAQALTHGPLLLFLNPGLEACIGHCRSRPWEPHKYRSKQEQDERLPFLLNWVRDYYTREGDMSLAAHRSCYETYEGRKEELTAAPKLDPPSAATLRWLE